MFFLALLLGIVPGFAWLVFYLSEDPYAEPKRLIALTFFFGIAFGFFTIIIEQLFNGGAAAIGIQEFSILSLLGLAFIEEFMKFAAAHFAVAKTGRLDQPIDAMIYMIVAALGFATLENIGAITNAASAASGAGGPAIIASVFETVSLRFVGATLLHSLTSGIVGYHWALGITKKNVPHYLIAGFIAATLVHATFNYLILNYGSAGYTVLFLMVVGFFVLNDFEKLKVAPNN